MRTVRARPAPRSPATGGPAWAASSTAVYSLKFQSEQIFLSQYVNEESQILYDRSPVERVQKAAPYLTIDSDPYPTVVDGKVKWVVDGYTTSSTYPYSTPVEPGRCDQRFQRASAAGASGRDQLHPQLGQGHRRRLRRIGQALRVGRRGSRAQGLAERVPVDASSRSPRCRGELMSHVRYPTDLFKVQREMLGVYHVDNANSFYQRDNVWNSPDDPQNANVKQPPYYLTMQMPNAGRAARTRCTRRSFRRGRARTAATCCSAISPPMRTLGRQTEKSRDDYGTLRLLQISSDTTVAGPWTGAEHLRLRPVRSPTRETSCNWVIRSWSSATCSPCRSAADSSMCSPCMCSRLRAPRIRCSNACSSRSVTSSHSRTRSPKASTRSSAATRAPRPVTPRWRRTRTRRRRPDAGHAGHAGHSGHSG